MDIFKTLDVCCDKYIQKQYEHTKTKKWTTIKYYCWADFARQITRRRDCYGFTGEPDTDATIKYLQNNIEQVQWIRIYLYGKNAGLFRVPETWYNKNYPYEWAEFNMIGEIVSNYFEKYVDENEELYSDFKFEDESDEEEEVETLCVCELMVDGVRWLWDEKTNNLYDPETETCLAVLRDEKVVML